MKQSIEINVSQKHENKKNREKKGKILELEYLQKNNKSLN